MKRQLLIFGIALTAFAVLSFNTTEQKKKYLVTREWMSDAYLQIRPTIYDYDDQGRVIRSQSENPDTFVTTNTYSATGLIAVSGLTTSALQDTVKYTLTNGQVTSDNRGNTYKYNSDGKLISGVDGEAYTWSDGDMTTREYYDGTQIHTVRYTYTSVEDMRDYGDAAWGMRSKHLVETISDPPNTVTHRYTFDPLGRVKLDSAGANVYHYFYRDF